MNNYSLSLVFPAYNEASNLESLIASAYKNASEISQNFEIIVVNDGSQDGTKNALDRLQEQYPKHLKPIHLNPNRGYAHALKTGFMHAKKNLIFYSDSDNQFDFSQISLLANNLKDNDMVIGYRVDRQDNFLRILVSKCYNMLIRFAFGLKVRDIDCAFKLFRKDIFKKISIDLEKFLIDTEILVKAKKLNMKISQVGVNHLPRASGDSTVKFSDVLFTLKGLVKLKKMLKTIQ